MRGKFIVLYGTNNVGKSAQVKRLAERLAKFRKETQSVLSAPRCIKYPLYKLEPSGLMLNAYLRARNPQGLTPREAQIVYAMNRVHFEPELRSLLDSSDVIAEDYRGTGIAWGMGFGVERSFLVELNRYLYPEDITILLDGERFGAGIEKNHAHENSDVLMRRVREIHLELASQYRWRVVNANLSEEEVHEKIWDIVKPLLDRA